MASEPGVVLEAVDLGFSYGRAEVLRQVSLSAAPGEIVGLIGPNGSGKSSLIRILSGVLSGYAGSARVGGREVRDLDRRTLARSLAVVPQEPSFAFPFTALEIVLLGRHPHLQGLAFESERDLALAKDALARCGVLALADRPIHELSSGERQRVVFAKALAQEPRALLLDEPASFLDIRHQVELYDLLRDLVRARGVAALTVLHDLNLAAEYCDRAFLLADGRIEASGPTALTLTAENLTRVFRTEVHVAENPRTGRAIVVPLPGRVRRGPEQS